MTTQVNASSAVSTTCPDPVGEQNLDIITVVAFNSAAALPVPVVTTGWVLKGSSSVAAISCVVYQRIAAGGAETIGTWSNCVAIEQSTYRDASGVGTPVFNNSTGATLTYSDVPLVAPGGSWVGRGAASLNASNMTSSTLTGFTRRTGQTAMNLWDSNGPLASNPGSGNESTNGSGAWMTAGFEIFAVPASRLVIARRAVHRAASF